MTTTPALEVHDLTKTYGTGASTVRALSGVSLVLDTGTFTAVMGPSGSGKSTLLNCAAGEPVDEIVDALVLPLVEHAVPEWQATLDALLALPEMGGPVGCEGGLISVGIRLAVVEPRISAALLFAGSFVPRTLFEEARQVTIPLQVLLQWDDEGNDRQLALDLFDAFGSQEKTLHANLGGHTGVPSYELDAAARFFARHLSQPSAWPCRPTPARRVGSL